MKRLLLVLLSAFALSLLVACSGSATPEPLEITLRAQDIKFDLSHIEARMGQTVKITYINEGALDHNFVLSDFGVEETVKPGETQTIEFTANREGDFKFVCNIPGHLEAGMVGTLTVKP